MELELENWYKPSVDRKKLKEISKRKDWPGLVHFFIYFVSLFVCGYFAYLTWGTLWTILWFFLYGSIFQFSVSNWHETVHRTAFKEFHQDTLDKNFNDPKITVSIDDREYDKFLELAEKI